MPTVTPDVIYSSKIDYTTTGGGTCERIYRVDNLTPGPNIGFDAIQAVQANGGQLQQQHPTALNFYVDGYSTRPGGDAQSPSQTSVWVTVHYSTNNATPNFVLIEFGGSHAQHVINRWQSGPLAGKPILVGYSPNERAQFSPDGIDPSSVDALTKDKNAQAQFDTVNISVESHNVIIRFTRREVGSPLTKIQKFIQTVNAKPWFGNDIGFVLMRDIVARNITTGSIIAPGMYEVTYEMEISSLDEGWARVEFFKDIHTGRPIAGVNIADGVNNGNGYVIVNPYPMVDFSELKLPNPYAGTGAISP